MVYFQYIIYEAVNSTAPILHFMRVLIILIARRKTRIRLVSHASVRVRWPSQNRSRRMRNKHLYQPTCVTSRLPLLTTRVQLQLALQLYDSEYAADTKFDFSRVALA